MANHSRWYVNLKKWRPNKQEWVKLTSCVPENELERVNQFVFQEDSKSSLIGQILLRSFLSRALARSSNEIELTRSQYGRPEVCQEYKSSLGNRWPISMDFNVSHSGDYCVLAGFYSNNEDEASMTVGVDITKIVNKNTEEELIRFLDLMSRREFLPNEWLTVERARSRRDKCINFTRLWCLKESFIKSVGLGLAFGLRRIEFTNLLDSSIPRNPEYISDTKVILDGSLAKDWLFLETQLDDEHLVAIGHNLKSANQFNWIDMSPFEEIPITQLVDQLVPIHPLDEQNWYIFSRKPVKS